MSYSIDQLVADSKKAFDLGVAAVALFPAIDDSLKNPEGKESVNPDGLLQRAVKELKKLNVKNIRLIGTAGSEEKCNLAIKNGASNMINYRKENFPEKVLELTKGQGVPIVMDSVGKDTFVGSIDCLQPLGIMISFGNMKIHMHTMMHNG